jgi:hypothetical protein
MLKRRYNNEDTIEFVINKLQKININKENTQLIKYEVFHFNDKLFSIIYPATVYNHIISFSPINYALIIDKFNSINSLMSETYNKLNDKITNFNIRLDKIDKLIKKAQHQIL